MIRKEWWFLHNKIITREVALTLNNFMVFYRNHVYNFIWNNSIEEYDIINENKIKISTYSKDDLLRDRDFEYFLPKNSNAINY